MTEIDLCNAAHWQQLFKLSPAPVRVLSVLGSPLSGKLSLLKSLFSFTYKDVDRYTSSPASKIIADVIHTPKILLMRKPSPDILVLNLDTAEGFDVNPTIVSLVCSDAIIINILYSDWARYDASFYSSLQASLQGYLLFLSQHNAKGKVQAKTLLLISMWEFDESEISKEESISSFWQDLKDLWDQMRKPSQFTASTLSDFFDFEFTILPHQDYSTKKFAEVVEDLRRRFLDSLHDSYFFEDQYCKNMTVQTLQDAAQLVLKAVAPPDQADEISSQDLLAMHQCDELMYSLFADVYRKSVKEWRSIPYNEVRIDNFGKISSQVILDVLRRYDEATKLLVGATWSGGVFPKAGPLGRVAIRKRDELCLKMIADLKSLYQAQLHVVREDAFAKFKEDLSAIHVTSKVEADVNKCITKWGKMFEQSAQGLAVVGVTLLGTRHNACDWTYTAEKDELLTAMREVATDRLDIARLNGLIPARMVHDGNVLINVNVLVPHFLGLHNWRMRDWGSGQIDPYSGVVYAPSGKGNPATSAPNAEPLVTKMFSSLASSMGFGSTTDNKAWASSWLKQWI